MLEVELSEEKIVKHEKHLKLWFHLQKKAPVSDIMSTIKGCHVDKETTPECFMLCATLDEVFFMYVVLIIHPTVRI